jgi:H+/Cl- antiporter ClcA
MQQGKSVGVLIVTLFVGVLIGGAVGQLLGLFLDPDTIVSKALVQPLITYVAGPWDLNLLILVITFGFKLSVNFFSILGLVVAWYYYRFSF